MKETYLESIRLTERMHRQFLEVVKAELDRWGVEDINNVQSLILFNIGRDEMTVGELTNRGYYLGSNVSYNVRKMVENGYLAQERSAHDRRSVRVRLTDKGLALCQRMDAMFDRQVDAVTKALDEKELAVAGEVFVKLEAFWAGLLNFGARPFVRD